MTESDVPPRRDSAAPPQSAASTAHSSPGLHPQDPIDDLDDMMNDPGLGISGFKGAKGKRVPWDASDSSSYTTPPPPPFRPRGSSSVSEDVCMDSPLQGFPPGFAARAGASSESLRSEGPSAAEISRRIGTKRRRDDDLDPVALKRRAVSPSVSVHNSPVLQSPMQSAPWGSRPGSNGGEKGASSNVSEAGSLGTPGGRGKGRV
ncbi:hypothetical protein IMZ48_46270, partial [Candidatus Bathyarchaeota archaeon]|nr:hypothetical protein [Candidatus Bathyarchaeota archaeon]